MTVNKQRQPSLRALKAFEAVSRHLKVSDAAEELCVTSSAISHLVKRLEQELGLPLLKRDGRNIALTPEGEQFAPRIQRIFRSLNHLIDDTREQNSPNVLNVSLRPYFAVKWLSPRLSHFWAQHPDIELRLIHTTKPTDFSNDRVDLAIEWSKGNRTDIKQSLLIPGLLTPVLSPVLAKTQKITQPKDTLKHILLRETDYDSWQDWLELAGVNDKPKKHTFIDDSNVRYQAAIDGQGIELGCRALIEEDIKAGLLITPFELSLNSFSYYLAEPLKPARQRSASEKFKRWLAQQTLAMKQ